MQLPSPEQAQSPLQQRLAAAATPETAASPEHSDCLAVHSSQSPFPGGSPHTYGRRVTRASAARQSPVAQQQPASPPLACSPKGRRSISTTRRCSPRLHSGAPSVEDNCVSPAQPAAAAAAAADRMRATAAVGEAANSSQSTDTAECKVAAVATGSVTGEQAASSLHEIPQPPPAKRQRRVCFQEQPADEFCAGAVSNAVLPGQHTPQGTAICALTAHRVPIHSSASWHMPRQQLVTAIADAVCGVGTPDHASGLPELGSLHGSGALQLCLQQTMPQKAPLATPQSVQPQLLQQQVPPTPPSQQQQQQQQQQHPMYISPGQEPGRPEAVTAFRLALMGLREMSGRNSPIAWLADQDAEVSTATAVEGTFSCMFNGNIVEDTILV